MNCKRFCLSIPFLLLSACSSSSSPPGPPVISCAAITSAASCTITYTLQPATQAATCTPPAGPQGFALNAGSSSYSGDGATCNQTFDGCALARDCSYEGLTLDYDFTFSAAASGATITGTASGVGSGTQCEYTVTGSCTD